LVKHLAENPFISYIDLKSIMSEYVYTLSFIPFGSAIEQLIGTTTFYSMYYLYPNNKTSKTAI
jgi:hypothetical protein